MPEDKEHHKRHPRKKAQQKPGVFDISRPHRISPSPTGRPIIVGHHPTMPDPMVRRDEAKLPKPAGEKTVPVKDEDTADGVTSVPVTSMPSEEPPAETDTQPPTETPAPAEVAASPETHVETSETPLFSETPQSQATQESPPAEPVPQAAPPAETDTQPPAQVPETSTAAPAPAADATGQPPADLPKAAVPAKPAKADRHDLIGTKPLPIPKGAGPYGGTRRYTLWAVSILLLLLLIYVLLDAGVIKTGLKLPVHLFKQ